MYHMPISHVCAVVHVPLVAMCIWCSGHVTSVWRGCIKPLQLDQIRLKTSLSGDNMGKVDTDSRHCLGTACARASVASMVVYRV